MELVRRFCKGKVMLICDLIDDLRRFPQRAKVLLCDRQILVDVSPLENNGNTVFDACCGDDELPDDLRTALDRSR